MKTESLVNKLLQETSYTTVRRDMLPREVGVHYEVNPEQFEAGAEGEKLGPGINVKVHVDIDGEALPPTTRWGSEFDESYPLHEANWKARLTKELTYYFKSDLTGPYRIVNGLEETVAKIVQGAATAAGT